MNAQALVPLLIQGSMFLVIMAYAMQCRWADVEQVAHRPAALSRAFLAIYVAVPLFALALVLIFPLERFAAVGLILMAVSPLAPLAPGNALKAGGQRSPVIGVYTLMIALAIVMVPMTIALLDNAMGVDAVAPVGVVTKVVLVSALIPIALGLGLGALWPEGSKRAAPIINKAAFAVLLVLLLMILWASRGPFLALIGNGTVLAFTATTAAGLFAGHMLGGPDWGSRGALAIAAATRHPGIAVAIAHANNAAPQATLATILFLLNGVIVAAIYQAWHRRREPVPADAAFETRRAQS